MTSHLPPDPIGGAVGPQDFLDQGDEAEAA